MYLLVRTWVWNRLLLNVGPFGFSGLSPAQSVSPGGEPFFIATRLLFKLRSCVISVRRGGLYQRKVIFSSLFKFLWCKSGNLGSTESRFWFGYSENLLAEVVAWVPLKCRRNLIMDGIISLNEGFSNLCIKWRIVQTRHITLLISKMYFHYFLMYKLNVHFILCSTPASVLCICF